jgi:hypothetical protein
LASRSLSERKLRLSSRVMFHFSSLLSMSDCLTAVTEFRLIFCKMSPTCAFRAEVESERSAAEWTRMAKAFSDKTMSKKNSRSFRLRLSVPVEIPPRPDGRGQLRTAVRFLLVSPQLSIGREGLSVRLVNQRTRHARAGDSRFDLRHCSRRSRWARRCLSSTKLTVVPSRRSTRPVVDA